MVKVQVHELKARLSHYLRLVQSGTPVIILKRNVEIGEITPPKPSTGNRELGLARKHYPDFQWDFSRLDETMSEEELALWYDGPIFPSEKK
jgi:prevent-host-death family protein